MRRRTMDKGSCRDAAIAPKYMQCKLGNILFYKVFLTPIYEVFWSNELAAIKHTEYWQWNGRYKFTRRTDILYEKSSMDPLHRGCQLKAFWQFFNGLGTK